MRKIKNYISNLKIKSFKGLEDVEIKDCRKLNILIGENNAGKTTVLEAVRCFHKPWDYMEYINILKRNPYANFSSFSLLPQMFNQRNHSSLAEIIVEIDKKEHILKIKKELEKIEEKTTEEQLLEEIEKVYIEELEEYNFDEKILRNKLIDKILKYIPYKIEDYKLVRIINDIIGEDNKLEKIFEDIKELKKSYTRKVIITKKLK